MTTQVTPEIILEMKKELEDLKVSLADQVADSKQKIGLFDMQTLKVQIEAKFDTRHARERMLQRSGIYVIDLKDCGIWWNGYFQMHRANIIHKNVTDKLECVMKIRANKLGVFTLKKGPLDSEFTVVTFYPEEGGSAEQRRSQPH